MRGTVRKLPRGALLCALVAGLSALGWSILTPPFQVPDENAHFAYSQYVAESHGELPRINLATRISRQQLLTQGELKTYLTWGQRRNRPIWFDEQQRRLERVEASLRSPADRLGGGSADSATYNPPAYYLVELLPYELSPSVDVVDRLLLMRLVSVFFAALTTLLAFMFVREVLPGAPWAWTVGGLAVAFQPLFGFLAGGVNNDNLLILAAAALFYAVARILRRGLTVRRGTALGLVVASGLLAKASFIGLVPGAALGLGIAFWRSGQRPRAFRAVASAVACAAVPVALYVLLNWTVWNRSLLPGASGITTGGSSQPFLDLDFLAYLWQFYLPRIPFVMDDAFPAGFYPLYDVWLKGFIGRYGWLDTEFPLWVYKPAAAALLVIAALATVELVRRRDSVAAHGPELAAYGSMATAFVVMLGLAGFRARTGDTGFEQARYLLPLLPLYAVLIALAARAGGRWGPALGAALVVLAAAHTLFSQLLVISRFYG
jgi:4-amino-4-deoxy-L-arabinose transferase-like glycosyltransferase